MFEKTKERNNATGSVPAALKRRFFERPVLDYRLAGAHWACWTVVAFGGAETVDSGGGVVKTPMVGTDDGVGPDVTTPGNRWNSSTDTCWTCPFAGRWNVVDSELPGAGIGSLLAGGIGADELLGTGVGCTPPGTA